MAYYLSKWDQSEWMKSLHLLVHDYLIFFFFFFTMWGAQRSVLLSEVRNTRFHCLRSATRCFTIWGAQHDAMLSEARNTTLQHLRRLTRCFTIRGAITKTRLYECTQRNVSLSKTRKAMFRYLRHAAQSLLHWNVRSADPKNMTRKIKTVTFNWENNIKKGSAHSMQCMP